MHLLHILMLASSLVSASQITFRADDYEDFTLQKRVQIHDLKGNYSEQSNFVRTVRTIRMSQGQPDVTDRDTVTTFAAMCKDAYYNPFDPKWGPVGGGYEDQAPPFSNDSTGLQGYVFVNPAESLVVVAIKGTSLEIFDIGGPTKDKDKQADNTLFSCCCGNKGLFNSCGCLSDGKVCSSSCYQPVLTASDGYFQIAEVLYGFVQALYPASSIWFTGHSLGGGLAALLANTYGSTAVTFEAPGDLLYSQRLGLGAAGNVYQFGRGSDPLFMGTCGWACKRIGYFMESQCHSGQICMWPETGWNLDAHPIKNVIQLINDPDTPLPYCVPADPNCIDCTNYTFEP